MAKKSTNQQDGDDTSSIESNEVKSENESTTDTEVGKLVTYSNFCRHHIFVFSRRINFYNELHFLLLFG